MKISENKIKYFAACALVSFSASALEAALGAQYHLSWLAGLIAGVAIGAGKEYGDNCAVGNKWDWYDITADLLGAITGASIGSVLSIIN